MPALPAIFLCIKMGSLQKLQGKKLLLASGSPRRQSLIKALDIPVEIVKLPEMDETYPSEMKFFDVPSFLAEKKSDNYKTELKPGLILVTADTVVLCEDRILNKPKDYKDAFQMLKDLSGNKHTVITGVCLRSKKGKRVFSAATEVFFSTLTDDEIGFYLGKYKPYDKAGAYGIQEWIGYIGIDRIEGSFYNVMGLPLHKLYAELKKLNNLNKI